MRAVRLIQPGHPLQLCDVPVPVPAERDVLVRIRAAGICHSDAHYRCGRSRVEPVPLTLGHEVAGLVEAVGPMVTEWKHGDRVCVHYLATCGTCEYCRRGIEQFCPSAKMMGKHRDGGYADFVLMPAASLYRLPDEISFEAGAIMMCSSATALHALNKAKLGPGQSVAVFGLGGLGFSAVQIARALGATSVYGVDIKSSKLGWDTKLGFTAVNAAEAEPVKQIRDLTDGRGVDVALELIGLPLTMRQAVSSLAIQGRAALAGITEQPLELDTYKDVLGREAEIIGVSDHLGAELPMLIDFARQGRLKLDPAISRVIPLAAQEINETLDRLEKFGDEFRVVIAP